MPTAAQTKTQTPTRTLEWDIVLRDGATIHVRPFTATDAEDVRDFLRSVSPESLFARFFGMISIEHFDVASLDSTDPASRFTLVAEAGGRILALATYVRRRFAHHAAELGFLVADHLRGRGLGTRLLELLADVARADGVTEFTAQTLRSNARMLEVFRDVGFPMTENAAEDTCQVTMSIAATERFRDRAFERTRAAAASSMRALFEPVVVAVVGASRTRGRIGSEIFHNLIDSGFVGVAIPVNPTAETIEGVKAYPSIGSIPGSVDVAVIAVPCEQVLAVADECIAKRVKGLVVISAGFGETGAEGQRLQAQLLEKVRQAGIRMIGPNCMGLLNTNPAVQLNATFAPTRPPAGNVAMSTQSGALGLAILDYAKELNIGISSFVSVGNKADVSGNDLIQYWSDDPQTDVILLYLESFGNPRTFSRLARQVARTKPIVAVKAGRSNAGRRAAASHTGALASSDAAVSALFQQSGVIRTDTLEEMFDVAAVLAHQPIPRGPRVAILTNAGGAGILAADAAESRGLQVAPLSETTVAALRAFLPAAASVANPVDMLASASANDYERTLKIVLKDEQVDSVLVIFVPPLVTDPSQVAASVQAAARHANANGKTVVASFMRSAGAPPELEPVPCCRFPEAAARALAHATHYGEWRNAPAGKSVCFPDVDRTRARGLVDAAMMRGGGWLTPGEAQSLLEAFGIPVAGAETVVTEDQAVDAAKRIGYPVALKAIGPGLLHKSDVGGVRLGLASERDLRDACRDLIAHLGDRMTNFFVQRMASSGVELFVGITQDPTFGPLLLCGPGGTFVELFGPPAMRVLPMTDTEADTMLQEMPGRALLDGYRGAPAADRAALRELLLRLSQLAETCPEIQEMDLNPVRVFEHGLSALDVRIRVGATPPPSTRRVSY
jgi:acetyl coenzyme A synthetase (ADP forming)-like protein